MMDNVHYLVHVPDTYLGFPVHAFKSNKSLSHLKKKIWSEKARKSEKAIISAIKAKWNIKHGYLAITHLNGAWRAPWWHMTR